MKDEPPGLIIKPKRTQLMMRNVNNIYSTNGTSDWSNEFQKDITNWKNPLEENRWFRQRLKLRLGIPMSNNFGVLQFCGGCSEEVIPYLSRSISQACSQRIEAFILNQDMLLLSLC